MREVNMYRWFEDANELRQWQKAWTSGSENCTDGFHFGEPFLKYAEHEEVPRDLWLHDSYLECDVCFAVNRWNPTIDDLLEMLEQRKTVRVDIFPLFMDEEEAERDPVDDRDVVESNAKCKPPAANGVAYLIRTSGGGFQIIFGSYEEACECSGGHVLTVWYRNLIPGISVEIRTGFGLVDETGKFTKDEWMYCELHDEEGRRNVSDGQHRFQGLRQLCKRLK